MDTVPLWVLLVVISALGALVLLGINILKDHIQSDTDVHADVKVQGKELEQVQEKDLPKINQRLDEHDERLHHHGREIQDLIGKDALRDRQK